MIGSFLRRVQSALERKWVMFIRQSTAFESDYNEPYGDVRAQQVHMMGRLKVHPDQIIMMDARGESGRGEIAGHRTEELLRLIETGTVGVVAITGADRLARNAGGLQHFLRRLAEHGGMLLINGRVYDPKEPSSNLSLGVGSVLTELGKDERAEGSHQHEEDEP